MIWRLILGNRVVRFIGGALVAFLGFVTFGMVQRRKGAQEARKQAELDRANANVKAERERVVLDAELDQETDLLARSRRIGVVRKTKP